MRTFDLPPGLRSRLSLGHPWVYRNQLGAAPELPSGTWVRVRCGGFSAFGLWDSEGPIAVRLFSRHGVPDAAWVAARVAEAWQARAPIRCTPSTAYRWLYGESDGLPGIVVDLYADYAVIQTYAGSVAGIVPWVAEALHAHHRLSGVLERRAGAERATLWGRPPPGDLVVEEHGLLFSADLSAGQKTGLYLDQRENRRTLADWCQGRSLLDCFCYSGGFSLNAARQGAGPITLCDAAAEALEAARRNFRLNALDPSQHAFVAEDGFEFLARMGAAGRRFAVVCLDPPSFSRDRQSRHAAARAYERLNRLAIQCVESGGLLASSSCTSQVSAEAFREALAQAARQAGRRLVILHEAGQPLDHPVAAHFPEARYLKFVIARVLPLT